MSLLCCVFVLTNLWHAHYTLIRIKMVWLLLKFTCLKSRAIYIIFSYSLCIQEIVFFLKVALNIYMANIAGFIKNLLTMPYERINFVICLRLQITPNNLHPQLISYSAYRCSTCLVSSISFTYLDHNILFHAY